MVVLEEKITREQTWVLGSYNVGAFKESFMTDNF